MVLNQKCQNKVKSYLCSSAAASAEQGEGTRPDAQDSKQLSEGVCVCVCIGCWMHSVHPTPRSVGAKVEPLRKTNLIYTCPNVSDWDSAMPSLNKSRLEKEQGCHDAEK